ncbi:hypothetical protein EGW08_019041 [Elysia chlorotica]|uniref:ZMYM2-like/QRICH1 C-terminal domain-containing protein n=1 Tax=Elysia chlorotica TaxID=188477 RepID=A0A433SV78_ELYCH|nr:hypothetical protein EGW08_019041 [Elysia chlorotica]
MLRRNQGSSKVNFRQRNYRVWADPSSPEKDPVTIYKFYAQKRPASTNTNFSPFYLGVNVLFPTQGQPWYRPAAMGINKLNEMVRQIRDITGVRTTSDFQAPDSQSKEKVVLEMSSKEHANGHELVHNTMERQELESRTIKTEVLDGEDDEDSCSNLAIDFSQEAQASPMGAPSTTDVMSALTMQHTVSEGDNSNDSFQRHLQQGLMAHINGVAGHNIRPGQFGQDEDLDLTTNGSSPPDSPLNCSTKDRNVEAQMEEIQHASSPMLMEPVSVDQAKQQLMYIVRKMEPTSLVEFEHWLRAVKFEADPFSGQIVYKEDERSGDTPSLSVKATSSCGSSGANIVLNISLSQKALQGDCPITLSAEASPLTSRERDSPVENSKPALPHGKLASPHSSALSSPKTSASSSSKLQNVLQLDAPLDLATSPLSKSGKSSSSSSSIPPGSNFWSTAGSSSFPTNGRPLLTSLFANNNTTKTSSSGSNGNNSSTTAGLDSSPLAKRLRLSAEQAEAYTSASILASLSSASMANERLRLHLMQGLSAGTTPSYGLDPHTAAGLLDLAASSEVMRSQLLQHYGMKAEPK